MADKLGLGTDVKELRLGSSFTNPRGSAFHTFRYDFKPASVDTSKMATVDILPNNEVNVTVPHCDNSGAAQTSVFRGPKKPYTKECVLIIDHNTGEITLERLSHNIQLKKTRAEGTGRAGQSLSPDRAQQQQAQSYPSHSTFKKTSPIQKSPPSTYSSATPSPPYSSPPAVKVSPKHGLGVPGFNTNKKSSSSPHRQMHSQPSNSHVPPPTLPGSMPTLDEMGLLGPTNSFLQQESIVGVLSDSSSDSGSDSSSDSSDSDSDDSDMDKTVIPTTKNGGNNSMARESASNSTSASHLSMPSHLLSEDLRLSDSGSDSD